MGKITTTGGPKCPDSHPGTPLLKTGDRHIWQCPISQAFFKVKIDEAEAGQAKDKFGRVMTTYTITGSET